MRKGSREGVNGDLDSWSCFSDIVLNRVGLGNDWFGLDNVARKEDGEVKIVVSMVMVWDGLVGIVVAMAAEV
ncbi:hypothetical protein ACH5RR_034434 [Cinchona calisaya]|uniref:Uncharacterized protein n=1 Tax=Cinchona calisaya TaxID=153742 RepID=A0ABD2YC72_9GENT